MRELWQLFITFLKIGTFTFGGGYAMIPAIYRETVSNRNWVSEDEIADYIAICQSVPGAFSINVAILIGKKVKGLAGTFIAVFGIVFPAFASILLILLFLGKIEDNIYVKGAFQGIMSASVALILVTIYQMGFKILRNIPASLIAIVSFILIIILDISAVWAIILGGLFGYISYCYRKRKGN